MKSNPFTIKEDIVQDRSVRGYRERYTSGDAMIVAPETSGWLGKSVGDRGLFIFYFVVSIVFVALIAQAFYIQAVRGNYYLARAENNRLKVISIPSSRGIIYDRYERPLVRNEARFYIYLNPTLIQNDSDRDGIRAILTRTFPDKTADIDTLLTETSTVESQAILIAEEVPYETALLLMTKTVDMPALHITQEPRRSYPYSYGLGHVLGYVGRITKQELSTKPSYAHNALIGKTGAEKQFDKILRGTDGSQTIEINALGHEKQSVANVEPRKGSDVTLSIDLDMQKTLYGILERASQRNALRPAVGVVLDPYSGEVLALVSYPSFDPNTFNSKLDAASFQKLLDDPAKPLFMRATSGEYPPGSTFKMVVASAALEEKLIDDRFTVTSVGGVHLGNRFFPDWRSGGHGITNIYKALADSVNSFFYVIGGGYGANPGLGITTIGRYARALGFGATTGIDLPGEADGLVPTPELRAANDEQWYQGDTYNVSIGQGFLLATPLQIARYTAFFASGGTLITPTIIKNVSRDKASEASKRHGPESALRLSNETIRIVRAALRQTVTSGTAQSMLSVRVPVAGKTGTAQVSNTKDPHSWFTGFAPFDNPKLAITILVEEGGERGLAVTAAREFLEWYFNDRG